jgi:dipeptidyl aminopeptidase/acylaminoacyl peptidase
MRRYARELVFGMIAIGLVVGYGVLGARAAPLVIPAGTPTPTPTKPVSAVPAPQTAGTIAFALRGDVYILRDGKYVSVTSDARSLQPNLSEDGRTLLFARAEAINGKRNVEGQVTPAILRYTDIVKKDSTGGAESIVLTGLLASSPSGFHTVAWFNGPALSPDAKQFAVTTDAVDGASDLEIFDLQTGKRSLLLSQGSFLADPTWAPDGKTIAVTSYKVGEPRILLVPADGRAAAPLAIKGTAGETYRPSYSPDGIWITYTLRHDGRNDVHAVEVKTGRDIELTTDGKSWNSVFSPDGKQLAFLRESGGVIDLYMLDVSDALAGGPARTAVKLTRGEGIDGDSRPAWGR